MTNNIDYEKYISDLTSKEGFFEEYKKETLFDMKDDAVETIEEKYIWDIESEKEEGKETEEKIIEVDFDNLREINKSSFEKLKSKTIGETKMKIVKATIFTTNNCLACESVKKTLYGLKEKVQDKYILEISEVAVENASTRKRYNVYVFPTTIISGAKIIGSKKESEYLKAIENSKG